MDKYTPSNLLLRQQARISQPAIPRAVLLSWLIICLLLATSGPAQAREAVQPVEDSVLRVEGRLLPQNRAELVSATSSRAEQVLVQEGQTVEAGQTLVVLTGEVERQARVDEASVSVISAQQALDDLYSTNAVELAQEELNLAQAQREKALAQDALDSLIRPKDPFHIEQVYANLLLAEKRMNQAKDDLEKAKKKLANNKSLIWYFVSKHDFKLHITVLEGKAAAAERHYWDAKEKYEDLIAPPDPIDVSLAHSRLAQTRASVQNAELDVEKKRQGPDPDALETAQAQLQAAQSHFAAAQSALQDIYIKAPISGTIVDLQIKTGEWIDAGQVFAHIADLSTWQVETKDLKEIDLPQVKIGQPARLTLRAYPDQQFSGTLSAIDLLYKKEDGDIYYTATIHLLGNEPIFRWGLTALVDFTGY